MADFMENEIDSSKHRYFDLKNMPHIVKPMDQRQKLYSNALEAVGWTPIIKLNRIPQDEGIKCDMYVKAEYLNPGGSIKDRIAERMVVDAETRGLVHPDKTVIIEPTSGNTGIGLALVSAIKGYKCTLVVKEKNSDEKVNTLRALGAKVVRTPDVPSHSPESDFNVAAKLARETHGGVVLGQFDNPCNPLAHYDGTAEEILWSFDDDVDMVVIGAGTSGTVSGIGHKIKERCPKCQVVCVDPYGSILDPSKDNPDKVTAYEVEGVGDDFLPRVLDRSVVDHWVKTGDEDSFKMARRLIWQEGLLAGGSSGAAVWAACQAARSLKPGQKCVVLLPDSIRNYMTKFVSDQWMEARHFKPIEPNPNLRWWEKILSEPLVQNTPRISLDSSVLDAFWKLLHCRAPLLIIEDAEGLFVGVFTVDHARQRLANLGGSVAEPLGKFAVKSFNSVMLDADPAPTLGRVSRLLDIAPYVIALKTDPSSKKRPIGVITAEDLMMHVIQEPE